jgi:hypothetical protein
MLVTSGTLSDFFSDDGMVMTVILKTKRKGDRREERTGKEKKI